MTMPQSVVHRRPVPWKVFLSAYCVPVLIVTQFAFLAAVPVLVLLVSTVRNVRSPALRWLAVLLGVVYASPYALWKFGPNPGLSFSNDINPAFATLIILVSVILIVAAHIVSRRGSRTLSEPTPEGQTVTEGPEAAKIRDDNPRGEDMLTDSIVTEKEISIAVGILLAMSLGAMAVFGFLVKQLDAPVELLYGSVAVSLVVGLVWVLATVTCRVRGRKDPT